MANRLAEKETTRMRVFNKVKFLALLTASAMAIGITSCGDSDKTSGGAGGSAVALGAAAADKKINLHQETDTCRENS